MMIKLIRSVLFKLKVVKPWSPKFAETLARSYIWYYKVREANKNFATVYSYIAPFWLEKAKVQLYKSSHSPNSKTDNILSKEYLPRK